MQDSPASSSTSSDDWTKHWFVLGDKIISFYPDSKSSENSKPDGTIDLSTCHSISEASVSRNYGFSLKVSIILLQQFF